MESDKPIAELLLGELREVLVLTIGEKTAERIVTTFKAVSPSDRDVLSQAEWITQEIHSRFGSRVGPVVESLLVRELSKQLGINMNYEREPLVEYMKRTPLLGVEKP